MSWRSRTYNELPALSVRREELRRSLRRTTMAWMYGIVWMSCTSGSQVKVFASMMGFTDWHFGLMTALPFLATLGQLPASALIERSGLKKYQFLFCGSIHRLLWAAVALIPLVFGPPSPAAVWALLAVLLASWFMNALAMPAWLTWMGDLIPKKVRGRYFANRAVYTRPVQIATAIALGVLLDWATGEGARDSIAAQPRLLWVICGIFVVGGVFGVLDVLLFHSVREVIPTVSEPSGPAQPPPAPSSGPRGSALRRRLRAIRELLWDPLKERAFRHYVGYGFTITFALALPGWFVWRNAMDNLQFSKLAVNFLFLVVSPILGLVGAKLWGRAIDRWGRRPVLVVATCLVTFSIWPWLIAMRGTPAPRFVTQWANAAFSWLGGWFGRPGWAHLSPDAPVGAYLIALPAALLGGIAWTGINLAQTAVVLGFSDGRGRSKYMATSAALIGTGGLLGGVVGGAVAQGLAFLQTSPLRVGPLEWNNWHVTFILSSAFRALSVLWLIGMPDPGSRPVRQLARTVGESISTAVVGWLFFPLRVFGWGRSGEAREEGQSEDE